MIPLRIALWQREREGVPFSSGDLINRIDAGSQYTAIRLTEHLALEGIAPSIGTVGDAYDCQSLSTRLFEALNYAALNREPEPAK